MNQSDYHQPYSRRTLDDHRNHLGAWNGRVSGLRWRLFRLYTSRGCKASGTTLCIRQRIRFISVASFGAREIGLVWLWPLQSQRSSSLRFRAPLATKRIEPVSLRRGSRAVPTVFVANPKTVVFPDYSGNKMYNSLGNILANPHIGMLFMDFPTASRLRLRVNGKAEIAEDVNA